MLARLGSRAIRPVSVQRQVIRLNGNATKVKACADQLSEIMRSTPDEAGALIKAVPIDCRQIFVARAIKEHFEDREMDRLISLLSGTEQRALGVAALAAHFGQDFQEEFDRLDRDSSGDLSKGEFKRYLREISACRNDQDSSPPSNTQLVLLFCNAALPNVIFGLLDNSIMIIGGDIVDDMIGSTFHLSTLACAGLANTVADVLGMSVGSSVERFSGKLGMPRANLSSEQIKLPIVKRVSMVAGPVGILIGCLMGMTPLLFIAEKKENNV